MAVVDDNPVPREKEKPEPRGPGMLPEDPELDADEIGAKINALFAILDRGISREDKGKIIIELIKAGILFKAPVPPMPAPFGGGSPPLNSGPPNKNSGTGKT